MPQSTTTRRPVVPTVASVRHVPVAVAAVVLLLLGLVVGLGGSKPARAAAPSNEHVVVPMAFPVIGEVDWSDTWLACRAGCSRPHLGQDLLGRKMQELVAGFDGTVTYLKRDSSSGNYISIRSNDRQWTLNYLHVNNDTPGTDDGRGTASHAFPAGLTVGSAVRRGQLIGWLGDSGNAEGTTPHLHIELRRGEAWSGTPYNLAPSLEAAEVLSEPSDGTSVRPLTSAPTGAFDTATLVERDAVRVTGWAYDADVSPAPVDVQVLVDGAVVSTVPADQPRPDVTRATNGSTYAGFDTTVPVAPGPRQVCVLVPDDEDDAAASLGCREVEAGDRAPVGSLDGVEAVPGAGVRVHGWAFDPDAADLPVTVTVRLDGAPAATVDADGSRPDVHAAWGVGEAHGFDVTVPARPGSWEVCVTGEGDGTAPLELGCATADLTSAELNGLPRRVRTAA